MRSRIWKYTKTLIPAESISFGHFIVSVPVLMATVYVTLDKIRKQLKTDSNNNSLCTLDSFNANDLIDGGSPYTSIMEFLASFYAMNEILDLLFDLALLYLTSKGASIWKKDNSVRLKIILICQLFSCCFGFMVFGAGMSVVHGRSFVNINTGETAEVKMVNIMPFVALSFGTLVHAFQDLGQIVTTIFDESSNTEEIKKKKKIMIGCVILLNSMSALYGATWTTSSAKGVNHVLLNSGWERNNFSVFFIFLEGLIFNATSILTLLTSDDVTAVIEFLFAVSGLLVASISFIIGMVVARKTRKYNNVWTIDCKDYFINELGMYDSMYVFFDMLLTLMTVTATTLVTLTPKYSFKKAPMKCSLDVKIILFTGVSIGALVYGAMAVAVGGLTIKRPTGDEGKMENEVQSEDVMILPGESFELHWSNFGLFSWLILQWTIRCFRYISSLVTQRHIRYSKKMDWQEDVLGLRGEGCLGCWKRSKDLTCMIFFVWLLYFWFYTIGTQHVRPGGNELGADPRAEFSGIANNIVYVATVGICVTFGSLCNWYLGIKDGKEMAKKWTEGNQTSRVTPL